MEFIKSIIKNKKLIWQLGKNDFKNRFANTSLGMGIFTTIHIYAYICNCISIYIKNRKNRE